MFLLSPLFFPQDLLSKLTPALAFIESAVEREEAILVHCVAGVSRSATVVIAYVMARDKIKRDEAMEKVRGRGALHSAELNRIESN